jgi:bacterioferritin-associated ferredoxin
MYVCLCNALTSGEVKQIVDGGCRSVASVYKRLGCRPNCGKCVVEMKQILKSCLHPPQSQIAAQGAD